MDSHNNLHSGMQMEGQTSLNKFGTDSFADLTWKQKPTGIVRDSKFTKKKTSWPIYFSHDCAHSFSQQIGFPTLAQFLEMWSSLLAFFCTVTSPIGIVWLSFPFHCPALTGFCTFYCVMILSFSILSFPLSHGSILFFIFFCFPFRVWMFHTLST